MEMNYNGEPKAGADMDQRGDILQPGTVIGSRFRIEAFLGSGGLGNLYRALDQESQKPVALRTLTSEFCQDELLFERLREQVRTASTIQYKNVGAVFGIGKDSYLRFIAMEFVDGRSLRHLLVKKQKSGKTFSLKGAYNVLAHVCNALHHAHTTMVHGLVGPGCILINRVGRVKVCEFGIARALPARSSLVAGLGDSYCISPEMVSDPASAGIQADIYSLGIILFELLTGHPPKEPDIPPSRYILGLPPEIDDVVKRCLQIQPEHRYANAREVKAAFYAALKDASEQPVTDQQPVLASAAMTPPPSQIPAGNTMQPETQSMSMSSTGPGGGGLPASDQIAAPGFSPQPPVAQGFRPAVSKEVSIEKLLADGGESNAEKWLIQKDRLDFGPFSLIDLKQQLYKGEFTGDDVVVDQESGERSRIRSHPALREFIVHLEKHFEVRRAEEAELTRIQRDKRRRSILVGIVAGSLAILGAGGAAIYYLTRNPEVREKLVYREKDPDLGKILKGIDITWKKEPEDQAKKRRRLRKRRARKGGSGGADDDVTRLGDVSQEGGDDLLSQAKVQKVMASSFGKLKGCVFQEVRRNPSLRQVIIDFGIRGSGEVSSVKVNNRPNGPFHSCIFARMKTIKFPSFDGSLTRASFSMNLKY